MRWSPAPEVSRTIPGRQSDASVKGAGWDFATADFGVAMVMFSARGENNQDISAATVAQGGLLSGTMSQNCHAVLGRLMSHSGASGPSGVIGMRLAMSEADGAPNAQLAYVRSVEHFPATFLASEGAAVEALSYTLVGESPVRVHGTPFHVVQDLPRDSPVLEARREPFQL